MTNPNSIRESDVRKRDSVAQIIYSRCGDASASQTLRGIALKLRGLSVHREAVCWHVEVAYPCPCVLQGALSWPTKATGHELHSRDVPVTRHTDVRARRCTKRSACPLRPRPWMYAAVEGFPTELSRAARAKTNLVLVAPG